MDADVIRAITFSAALVVLISYGVFVMWRVRVHRRRREAEEGRATNDSLSSDATLRPTRPAPTVSDPPPAAAEPVPHPPTRPAPEVNRDPTPPIEPAAPPPPASPGRPATVLDAVQGIALPHDLVPHPDAAPRPAAVDRVALTGSMISEEDLIDGLTGALTDLDYEITWAEAEGLARKGPAELRVSVYTSPRTSLIDGVPAFPLAVEGAVVVDFWIPRDD